MSPTVNPRPLDIQLFDGELVLRRRLGYGMMNAQIFRGTHASLGDVVCKIIPIPPDEQEARRMQQYVGDEIDFGRRLRSPYIRQMLDDGVLDTLPELHFPEGVVYMLFEWVPETLDGILRGGLPVAVQILRLAHALGAGLKVAHESLPPIVHRDLKPQNVLVVDREDLGTAKLADFGIARMAGGTRVTSAHAWAGTEIYMAPEQFESSATVTPRADIYALALLIWESLTGIVPLTADSTSALRALRKDPVLPELLVRERRCRDVRNVLRWALHPDPFGRPQSVEVLVRGLADAGASDGLWTRAEAELASAPPPGSPRPVPRVLIPPEQGDDERASGGALTLRLPPNAAAVIERVTPNVEWTYSLTQRLWSTVAASVGVEQVARILQMFVSREPLRVHEEPAKYSSSPSGDGPEPIHTAVSASRSAAVYDETPKASAEPAAPEAEVRVEKPRDGSRLASVPLVRPSPTLAAIIGDQPMPRFEVANRIWAYVKEHGLQDPANPQRILPDEKLKALFGGRSTISTLEMTTVINRHLRDA